MCNRLLYQPSEKISNCSREFPEQLQPNVSVQHIPLVDSTISKRYHLNVFNHARHITGVSPDSHSSRSNDQDPNSQTTGISLNATGLAESTDPKSFGASKIPEIKIPESKIPERERSSKAKPATTPELDTIWTPNAKSSRQEPTHSDNLSIVNLSTSSFDFSTSPPSSGRSHYHKQQKKRTLRTSHRSRTHSQRTFATKEPRTRMFSTRSRDMHKDS